jgi:hypothetical protein
MSDDNNELAGRLPTRPHAKLTALADVLVGRWRMHGPTIDGTVSFEVMEGGFFLIHRFALETKDEKPKGIEYIGWNETTGTLRSRLFGVDGSRYTYTWELDTDARRLLIWFGDPGAEVKSDGRLLSRDRIEAAWKGPEVDGKPSGYSYRLDRLE